VTLADANGFAILVAVIVYTPAVAALNDAEEVV
jgi:hypothetical protein